MYVVHTLQHMLESRMPLRLLQMIDDEFIPNVSNATLQSG